MSESEDDLALMQTYHDELPHPKERRAMTDEERVLEIAARLMAAEVTTSRFCEDDELESNTALDRAEMLIDMWKMRTAPREQPAQDVSDELLAQLINCAAEASNGARLESDERRLNSIFDRAREIQRARAAQREG